MKRKIVGVYHLGDESVQLVLREGKGAEFYERPGDIPNPRMKIGADHPTIGWLMDAVMHEGQERSMAVMRLRLQRADSYYVDSTAYLFVLTHEEFTEACHRAGMFLAECLPDLTKAWKKWGKAVKQVWPSRAS